MIDPSSNKTFIERNTSDDIVFNPKYPFIISIVNKDDYRHKQSFFQKRLLKPNKSEWVKVIYESLEKFIYCDDMVLFSEIDKPNQTCASTQNKIICITNIDEKLKVKISLLSVLAISRKI